MLVAVGLPAGAGVGVGTVVNTRTLPFEAFGSATTETLAVKVVVAGGFRTRPGLDHCFGLSGL